MLEGFVDRAGTTRGGYRFSWFEGWFVRPREYQRYEFGDGGGYRYMLEAIPIANAPYIRGGAGEGKIGFTAVVALRSRRREGCVDQARERDREIAQGLR